MDMSDRFPGRSSSTARVGSPERSSQAGQPVQDAHFSSALAHFVDELRASEYGRLDRLRHVYLDYTGAGLYAESQLRSHLALLNENVFGNPHSMNPTSAATTGLVERTRQAVLSYFRASPDEYDAIFTLNASGALKLIGESYPFGSGGKFLLTYDNHNSVNGFGSLPGTRALPSGMSRSRIQSSELTNVRC